MPRPSNNDIEQDKLARFDRIKKAIAQLEKQQRLFLKQGELAPEAAWVARYQVRQNIKRYWYYKLQVPYPSGGDKRPLNFKTQHRPRRFVHMYNWLFFKL